MIKYDYSQPYITRDEYLEVKGIDLNIELQDDDNSSNKVNRFIQDITNFVLDHLVMEYNCNELNRQTHNFEDLAEFRRVRFHYGMLEEIEYVLNNGLIQLDSGINRETGTITDFSGLVIGSSALKQFRLGGFCNKQEGSTRGGSLSPREMPTIEELLLLVSRKVDKVDGKGLSTNDFTTAYKLLLESLSREIENKVDKVVGKVLSDNNFTNELLQKLLGIEAGAQVNKIEEIRINNVPVSITGKAVNLTTFEHDDTKEDVANKVTTISSESTDAQYPTAKCVYDNIQTVLEVALGSTKAFSVDPTTTGNEAFQGTGATITVTSFVDVNGNVVDVSTLKKGDLVFTLNGVSTKYADRWLVDPATGAWGLIDADTPNLEGYAALSSNNTFTGLNQFPTGTRIYIPNTAYYYEFTNDNFGQIGFRRGGQYGITLDGDVLKNVSQLQMAGDKVIGATNNRVNKFYIVDIDFSGVLNPNAQGYGFVLPSSSGLSANKTLATDDQAFNDINASDIVNNTLTQEQQAIITNGKPTWIKGTLSNLHDIMLFSGMLSGANEYRGNFTAHNQYGQSYFGTYIISTNLTILFQKTLYTGPDGRVAILNLYNLNNKGIDYYLNNVYPYATNSTTELEYETINEISVSADTTFTLAAAPGNTYPEYKANITNSGANAINLTFPSGTVIKTNDTNITIASNVLTLPAGTTIEVNIQNGKMIAFNWDFGNAVQLISFTIDGITYQAEEGMTWAEWVDSEYNTDEFVVDGNDEYICPPNGVAAYYVGDSSSNLVKTSDLITANEQYSILGGGGSND